MRTSSLLARNLAWYWRTNLAVLLGVATATGVLGGAALVGDSVRASLRSPGAGAAGQCGFRRNPQVASSANNWPPKCSLQRR